MQTNVEQGGPSMRSSDEMLTHVRRELVGIHAAIDARTNGDREIVPWTLSELMALIDEIRAFQQGRP